MINGNTTNRVVRWLAAGIVLFLIAVGICVGAAGCSSYGQPPTPTVWTVSYAGTTYCPYEYDVHEIDQYGLDPSVVNTCTRVAFPSLSLVPTSGLQLALMGYWTTYSGFYESGWWYDTYYYPLGARYHFTVISRTSYMHNVDSFDHTYSSQIHTNSGKAKWSGGKTGNYQFPTTNKAKTNPFTNSGSGSKTTTKTNTKTGGGSTGKTGSGKSGTVPGSRRK